MEFLSLSTWEFNWKKSSNLNLSKSFRKKFLLWEQRPQEIFILRLLAKNLLRLETLWNLVKIVGLETHLYLQGVSTFQNFQKMKFCKAPGIRIFTKPSMMKELNSHLILLRHQSLRQEIFTPLIQLLEIREGTKILNKEIRMQPPAEVPPCLLIMMYLTSQLQNDQPK